MSDFFSSARQQTLQFSSLVLQGVFDVDVPELTISYSPLTKLVLKQKLPDGYLTDLVNLCSFEWEVFKTVIIVYSNAII